MSDLFGQSLSILNDSLQVYISMENLCIQITVLLEDGQKEQGKYFKAQECAIF